MIFRVGQSSYSYGIACGQEAMRKVRHSRQIPTVCKSKFEGGTRSRKGARVCREMQLRNVGQFTSGLKLQFLLLLFFLLEQAEQHPSKVLGTYIESWATPGVRRGATGSAEYLLQPKLFPHWVISS